MKIQLCFIVRPKLDKTIAIIHYTSGGQKLRRTGPQKKKIFGLILAVGIGENLELDFRSNELDK